MKSWKTSLAGLLGGLLITFGPTVGARLQGDPTAPPITSENYLPGITLLALGLLAKDSDKTNAPNPAPTHKAEAEDKPPTPPTSSGSSFPGTR